MPNKTRRPDRDRAERRRRSPPATPAGAPIVEDEALQRLPPGTRHLHRGRVPRRPAQRRHDLLVVPQRRTEPAAAGRRIRPAFVHAIHGGAKRVSAVHLARVEHDRIVRRRHVPGRPEGLRDLPPARHLRLQLDGGDQRVAEPAVPDGGDRHLQRHCRHADGGLHRDPDQRLPGDAGECLLALALRDQGQRLQLRRRLQRRGGDGLADQRGADDPGQLADRDPVLLVPRHSLARIPHQGQRRLGLRAALDRARDRRDVHGVPCAADGSPTSR